MKYNEIIKSVGELYPNEYDVSELKTWMRELEDVIAKDTGGEDVVIHDLSEQATPPPPYDRMFIDFVMAQIALHQHDDEGYSRYIAMFNSKYTDFLNWYVRTHPGKKRTYTNWI